MKNTQKRKLTPDLKDEAYRRAARSANYAENIDFDDVPVVSRGDDSGAYVQAWFWVSNEDAGICTQCGAANAAEGFEGLCGNCADKTENEPPEATS